MNNFKKQILGINESDSFLRKLCKISPQEEDDLKTFYQTVASLHNNNEINFIKEILNISNKDGIFFTVKDMFEKILPDLDVPIQQSMECVRFVFQESGDDMSAGMVFSSFVEYCEKDENRIKEALQIINNDISWYRFIPSIVNAGSKFDLDKYVKIAIEFIKHSDTNICKEAVFSLGKRQYENHPILLNQSFQAIKSILETTDNSGILSTSIEAIFTLSTFDNALEDEAVQLIKIALENSDDDVLYGASNLCCNQREKLPIKLFKVLLQGLERVNYQHKRTIRNIDYGLQYLLEKNQEMVVAYLEKVLTRNQELSIKSFESLLQDLYQKHSDLLNQIITKWFVSGDIDLCEAIEEAIIFFNGDKMILSASISQLEEQNSITHLFVIRKAIGWLFYLPISAVSFIVSMIEILDKDNIKEVEDLLFSFFLVSYPKSVRAYLKSIEKPKTKTKKVISNLLKRLEEYRSDLNSASNTKELRPSQEQRESSSRLYNQQFSKTMQESKEDSILSFVSEFTFLYGRKSVFYHPRLGSNPKDIRQEIDIRQEMIPQKIELSVEYPSLDFIDPYCLDFMLYVFKNEQLKK